MVTVLASEDIAVVLLPRFSAEILHRMRMVGR